jgi:hypothetical protein
MNAIVGSDDDYGFVDDERSFNNRTDEGGVRSTSEFKSA